MMSLPRLILASALLTAPLSALSQTAPSIVLPDVLAVELPAGSAQLAPGDAPVRELLAAAKSGQRTVTNDLKQPLTTGAVRVTFSAWDGTPGTGKAAATRSATLFVLPTGFTPVGASGDENATAGNNATRVVRDRQGRLHMVWTDGGRQPDKVGATYRRAAIGADATVQFETPPIYLAEKTPADWNAYPALAVTNDGVVALWQGGGTARVRRLVSGPDGYVWGPVRDTGAKSEGRDTGPAIVSDATGLHIVTPNGVYAFSADGGQTWRQEPIPLPARQKIKTASIAALPAGGVRVAFSLIVQEVKDTSSKKGSGGYWQVRTIRRMPDGRWLDAQDALAAFPPWQEPKGSQDVLADWVRVAVDSAGGAHLTWHGTAESRIYSNDIAYYAYQPPQGAWQE
ncbi:MAG: hypothetical protein JSS43_12805, partial [Proteobacteria bacterium]|nr:hypothetical protein [Pseudomonadota bacterium]